MWKRPTPSARISCTANNSTHVAPGTTILAANESWWLKQYPMLPMEEVKRRWCEKGAALVIHGWEPEEEPIGCVLQIGSLSVLVQEITAGMLHLVAKGSGTLNEGDPVRVLPRKE